MKHFVIYSLLVVLVLVCANCTDALCRRAGLTCKNSIECCSKYCHGGKCNKYIGGENPCNLVDCVPDRVCVLNEIWCIRAPCPPTASCVLRPQCSRRK